MKKCILVPDSFKGTLSQIEICESMEKVIRKQEKDCMIRSIPVADGGEGTVDCFLHALDGEKIEVTVSDPYFNPIHTYYGAFKQFNTAVIEMASCAGLTLVEKNGMDQRNPMVTTTFGVGELIKDAIEKGYRNLIIGLGGSCTNDAACGLAAALGIEFYKGENETFIPTGGTLTEIKWIDKKNMKKELKDCTITVMCDIDNPLYGEKGAAYVYAPQKGADETEVAVLDNNLRYFSSLILNQFGIDLTPLKGGGAAGGMGAGLYAFFNGVLKPGIDVVLDLVSFDQELEGADLIFTGEGRIDGQSIRGKVVAGVGMRAKRKEVPVIAVVGSIGEGMKAIYDMGVEAVISINQSPMPFEEARFLSRQNLEQTMETILRIRRIGEKSK